MSTEDLIVRRAQQLEKHLKDIAHTAKTLHEARIASKEHLKWKIIEQFT